jgi:hypothetical protein
VVEMRKNIMLFIIFLLISPNIVLSLEIDYCKSNDDNWFCEAGEICVCEISGDCTDGVLLVYEGSIKNLLCVPEIYDDQAVIDWDACGDPREWIDVRADCEEGQSDEETILVAELVEPPIDTVQTTSTTSRTTIDGGLEPCPLDYDCCEGEPEYEDFPCLAGMECINNECVKYDDEDGGINYGLIIGVIVIAVIAFLVYSFYLKKGKKMTFKKLYEKWS